MRQTTHSLAQPSSFNSKFRAQCLSLPRPRQRALNLGHRAADSGRPISVGTGDRAAAEWLVDRDLATWTSSGQMVLLTAALATVTTLEQPKLVSGPDDNLQGSVWGLRRKLLKNGWTSVTASACSVSEKMFNNKNAFKQYLALLLDRSLACVILENRLFLCCLQLQLPSEAHANSAHDPWPRAPGCAEVRGAERVLPCNHGWWVP